MTDQDKSQVPVRPEDNDVRMRRSSMHQAIDAIKAGYQAGDIVVLANKINEYVANGKTDWTSSTRTNGSFPG